MRKKILITGSCGFIGSNLVRKIIYDQLPYSVISIDRIDHNEVNSLYWNKNHNFYLADLQNKHFVDTIFKFEQPEIVIHTAEDNIDLSSNLKNTQNLIDASIKHKVNKFIYLSSDKVYGSCDDAKEDDKLNPNNFTAAHKISNEIIVQTAQNYGLNTNILRLSNNFGYWQYYNKLIPNTIKNILNNKNILIYGEGLYLRNWTHVLDTYNAIIKVMEQGQPNEIYNISSNHEFSNLEIVHKICDFLNKEGFNGHNLIKFDNKVSDIKRSINSDKIKKLGWKANYSIKQDLENCVSWYLTNRWWFK